MIPDLSIASSGSVGKRIAANTGLMMGAKALGVSFGLCTLLIATKSLTPIEFGTVIFLHAYMLFFAEVATFQSWQSIIRFGTDDLKNKDSQSLGKLIKFGIKLDIISVIFAYLASVGLFSLVVWISTKFPGIGPKDGLDITTLRNYSALYCVVVFARQIGTSIGIFRLFDRFVILACHALVMPIMRVTGSLYAASAGWGIEGFLAVWFFASLMSYLTMITLGLLELRRRRLLGAVFGAKASFLKQREGLWPFVIKANIDATLAAGSLHLPQLLVMAIFGAAWNGVYKIAEEISKLLSEGFKLLDQVIYPELAKLVANGDAVKIWRIVIRSSLVLVCVGLAMSLAVFFAGPLLTKIFGASYSQAAPMASLLVPAAALMGIVAPLYPIFYAANKPERAIYVRGAALIVYIFAFVIFSSTLGQLAPGWAMLTGNIFMVLTILYTARLTLRRTIAKQNAPKTFSDTPTKPKLNLIGQSSASIWGMPLEKWQKRAFKKAGCETETGGNDICADVNWIMAANLSKAFVATPHSALVVNDKVIASHGHPEICGQNKQDVNFDALGLTAKAPSDFQAYDKALRKTEIPYALDTRSTPIVKIMQRQFDSSYKGITDFVTKYFWPVPAFYVTRLCAHLRLTPNMVTTLSLIMMLAALYFFWQEQWILGFATGWFMTFLDTVDGKLARTTMTYSAWGNAYDHGIDLIHPPFWYWAWFAGLTGTLWADIDLGNPMMIALIAIFIGYVVDRIIEGIFILLHGFHIHVWRPINSKLRFITARRNPNMFIFMIGIILMMFIPDAGRWGFYAVAIWTWACIVFNIGIILVSLFVKRPLSSWMDEND